ncbi:response regulator [Arenibaculum pallidiluteum]|uniref:response regulator n=1 Tax=Arenibaculum pallidiluteum TaxID=2812559 RepID=UPI001A9565F5|nr:response regulator [Arenibaculum pallidiluteum]
MISRIYIVDDQRTNREVLATFSRALGGDLDVRTFSSPIEILEQIAVDPPDLVITDFKMPEIDGAELIRRLRAAPMTADVPVIVVTTYEDRDVRHAALEAGATDFLLSPVDRWEFQARARNLLTLRAQQLAIARQSLRESEARFRLLVAGIEDYAIFMLDAAGRVTSWNAGAQKIFGYTEEESADLALDVLVPREGADGASAAELLETAARTGRARHEGWLTRKDGERLCADVLVTALVPDAQSRSRFGVVAHDLTRVRHMNDSLRAALSSSRVLLKELQHRVRNNLQVISSILQMQRTRERSRHTRSILLRNEFRIDAMALLFRNLADPTRVTDVDLVSCLRELCELLERQADRPGAIPMTAEFPHLALEIDAAAPCVLLVEEILHTLILRAEGAASAAVSLAGAEGGYDLACRIEGRRPASRDELVGRLELGEAAIEAMLARLDATLLVSADEDATMVRLHLPAGLFAGH